MKLLKQRLKRLLVCLLAVSLLWQPIVAYAASIWGVNYGTFNGDIFTGSVFEFSVGDTIPAGAVLLADAYHLDDEQYQGQDKAALNKTLISNILNNNAASAEICEALFYVQESEDDMRVVYDYGGFQRKYNPDDNIRYSPLAYKLYDKYTDKDGKERDVTGWEIVDIDIKGGEVTEVNWVTANYVTTPQYDNTDYIYNIDLKQRQKYGTPCSAMYIENHEFSGFYYYQGENYKGLFIKYKLIQVKPIYADPLVSFDSQGGSECESIVVHKDENYGINGDLPTTSKEHHDFLGWFTKPEDGDRITENSIKGTDRDETLYAHWEEYKYTIHFDPNFEPGGGIMPDMTLKYSEEKQLTKNEFTREGYTFLGWNTDENATSARYQDEEVVKSLSEANDGEVTLYAIWQSLPTVTFDPQGGSDCDPPSKKVAQGTQYGDLPTTEKPYHTFLGWFTAAEAGTEITKDSTKTTDADETLYAHWEEYQYTIKFDANGGAGTMSDKSLKYSQKAPLTTNAFTRTDYKFLGWNTNPTATSAVYADGAEVQSLTDVNGGTVTLYAVWQAENSETPPPVSSTPTVTFDPNGGSACNPSSKKVAQGALYGDLPTTTRDKHTFLGWFTAQEGGTEITKDSIKATDADETLYAHWEEYQYIVKFDANGGTGTMSDMTLKYSQKTSLTKNAFTRSGYQFKGWNTDKDAVLVKYKDKAEIQSLTGENNGVVTLYAVWQKPSKEAPPKNPPEKDSPKKNPPKKTPDSPNGGGDNASQPPEIFKTYVAQKIENVKTADSIYIYRYLIMFVMGAGLIFLSFRFRKKQS